VRVDLYLETSLLARLNSDRVMESQFFQAAAERDHMAGKWPA